MLHAKEDACLQSNLLDLDADQFRASFNKRPFLIGHRLTDHPLFTLPRLVELSRRLPEDCIAYNAGDVTVDQGLYLGPRTGLSVDETIRRIEECRSWMVLKFVERDPDYRALLHSCLDQVGAISEALAPGMRKCEGFIFISSPGSVTPYHMDPEYNFLLQIRGAKRVHIFDPSDRSILSEQELEHYYTSSDAYLQFNEEYRSKAQAFELTPGNGLHVPVTAPHWVQNGDAVSISFSITFESPACERRSTLYALNAHLRRMG